MAELSAGEILLSQLEYEVREAKQGLSDRGADPDALENLCAKVVMRWWVGRMVKQPDLDTPPDVLMERQKNRAQVYAHCTDLIKARSGPIDVNTLQMAVLGLSSQLDAVWSILIESALVTKSGRQDYMDGSANDLLVRAQAIAQRIVTPGEPGAKIVQ